ncbi:MAG TPA: 3-oxoacyl-ACP synthase III [Pirellulales bacterium]|jgi:3-oxoacyl-[acyl-carrier-protein] synthase-3|nr:3-oxoacyl-ACP synthase III [Pirellulales bacterium]
MKYRNVCVEALGYTLPDEVISSEEIERRLEPLYTRLKLPAGRLELMTGIRERRVWPPNTLPSQISVQSGQRALDVGGIDQRHIGALIHGSVCRDFLEPATACSVHHHLALPADCLIYDVSNACLGLLNGMVQVANMIELGQIRAGLVVASEVSRPLMETTIAMLNDNQSLTRDTVKPALASLTIGSASAAVLLVHSDLSRTQNRLLAAVGRTHTAAHQLCHSGRDETVGGGMAPLMQTDAETLMHEGIAVGRETFVQLLAELGWSLADVSKTACHQVGSAHRKMMLEKFGLNPAIDFVTFPWLGNTGAAALPVTLAAGMEQGHYQSGDRIAMLGIGSGINVLMLAMELQQSLVAGGKFE